FAPDNLDTFDSTMDKLAVQCYCTADNFARLARARALADQMGLSVTQVAMAYVMSLPLNVFALVGCGTPEEFRANLAAAEITLPPETLSWLNLEHDRSPVG
ncbi:MAG: aldo/keto reductase, partial [Anaerolineae bacterium]|nr:aldo/keto reductase [Anaerolineae bacterium]